MTPVQCKFALCTTDGRQRREKMKISMFFDILYNYCPMVLYKYREVVEQKNIIWALIRISIGIQNRQASASCQRKHWATNDNLWTRSPAKTESETTVLYGGERELVARMMR